VSKPCSTHRYYEKCDENFCQTMKTHVKYICIEDIGWIQQVESTVQFVCSLEQCNGPQGSKKDLLGSNHHLKTSCFKLI